MMQLWFARIDPKTHRFVVERPPHSRVSVALESRSMLLHDLTHYAVETELQTQDGFYGLLTTGIELERLRDSSLTLEVSEKLMAIEKQVALLQTKFKRGEATTTEGAGARLRRIHGAWSKAKQGEALKLTWPNSEPELVSFDPHLT